MLKKMSQMIDFESATKELACKTLVADIVQINRTLPASGQSESAQQPGTSSFNLLLIVGLAIFITVLARRFSSRK